MGLAIKQRYQERNSVSKKEFEKAYVELIERVRVMDQRISTKADEVVLTMALSHRQQIDELETEILRLREDLKKVKQQEVKNEVKHYKYHKPRISWFDRLKRMQFSRR